MSALAVSVVIQSWDVEVSLFGESGTFVMVMSNPMVVKVELGCSDLFGVNAMSIGRARTSELRWSFGSMSIVVKGYAICASTIASGRVVANLLVMILWVLPLCVLAQKKAWSPYMSCCFLHLHSTSWGKIGIRNFRLIIIWKSVGDKRCAWLLLFIETKGYDVDDVRMLGKR